MNKVVLIISLLLLGLFLAGCTENIPSMPFSFSQYAKYVHEVDGSDFNLAAYYAGDYNNLCLARVDWNVLQMYDCNTGGGSGGDTNWSDIGGLPLSCPVGTAIQVLDDTLTCVDLNNAIGLDTNWETSWSTFDANMQSYYFGKNANLDWNRLQNYPSACPAGQMITALGDTITCQDVNGTLSSAYELLNGTNQPATGDKNVYNSNPKHTLTTSGDTKNTQWNRTSTNALAKVTNDIYVSTAGLDSVPTMTGYSTPSGTVTGSYVWSVGYETWKAFDDNPSTFSLSSLSGGGLSNPWWIKYQFPIGVTATRYTIQSRPDTAGADQAPKDWNFLGSNDGTNWTVLDTQTGITFTNYGDKKTFNFSNTTSYTYYDLNVTKVGSGTTYLGVAELEIINASSYWQKTNVWVSSNSSTNDEKGITVFGDGQGRVDINYGTNFNVTKNGASKGQVNASGDFNWFGKIYGANMYLPTNGKHYFGNSNNASIYHDGTNFFINPKEVGTSRVNILGDINVVGQAGVSLSTDLNGTLYFNHKSNNENILIGTLVDGGSPALTGTKNILIGGLAGNKTTTGTNNVLIGYKAGQTPTTGNIRNVFIGDTAGGGTGSSTPSSDNVFIGANAGSSMGAQQSVVIGSQAGAAAITPGNPHYSVFVGYGSGYRMESGQYNTAIGMNSLGIGTSSTRNTALGYAAGSALTSNGDGVYVGYNAGSGMSGNYNTIVGTSAGVGANSTGQQNVGMGYGVYTGNTMSGSSNTALGTSAGYSTSSGSNNTYLGQQAGFTQSTQSSSMYLGYQAGYNSNLSNKLFIDNQNRTDAASDLNSSLIVGDFNANPRSQKVRINGDLNVGYNLIVQGSTGITKNMHIVKDVNVDGTFYCDQNFIGGILVASTC